MKTHLGFLPLASAALLILAGCTAGDNWEKLNGKAMAEYLEPVRPGGVDGSPFWNVYSYRFIYAPAFDFDEIDGAAEYLFSIYSGDGDARLLAQFKADSPKAALSPVWNDIEPGNVMLAVKALDGKGKVLGEAGKREFVRDFPFNGPYPGPARDYREAALKGLLYVHNQPCIRAWAEGRGPDMSYPNNSYVCKIIGATVRIECLLAREMPGIRDEAMAAASAAADYLVGLCRGEGEALGGWPPTYGMRPLAEGGYVDGVVLNNAGKTMTEEASKVAEAFLDMFDVTSDSVWFDRALRIARTYARLQDDEGSWPVKVHYPSGEPACTTRLFPTDLLQMMRRLHDDYDVDEFDAAREKAELYLKLHVLPSFDMTGQFEDNLCDWTDPYSNLTNITAAEYSTYLLEKENPSKEDIRDAADMIRFAEDQFVHWDNFPDQNGFKRTFAPCVHEQRAYEEAIDDSGAVVAGAFLSLYERTGDILALEKAKALLNSTTRGQYAVSGRIPTIMAYNGGYDEGNYDFWVNCTWWTASVLMKMHSTLCYFNLPV